MSVYASSTKTNPLFDGAGRCYSHFGLTGPVILDVSRAVSGHRTPQTLSLELDFLPALKEADCDEWLRLETAAAGKKLLAAVLALQLPRRVADAVLPLAQLAPDRKAAALSKPERQRLAICVKRLLVPINGTLGFGKAEVTAGGVALDEVASRSLDRCSVKRIPPGLVHRPFIFRQRLEASGQKQIRIEPPIRIELQRLNVSTTSAARKYDLPASLNGFFSA